LMLAALDLTQIDSYSK